MNGFRDPVDDALDALRSDDWTAAPLTSEQENLLMQKADNQMKKPGSHSLRNLIVALAVLTIGGAAFAAGDGVRKLRTWLFDIELSDGSRPRMLVADGQKGTMIIEEDDGTITEIEAHASELEDGGMQTKVTVRKSDDTREEEDVHEVVRRRGPAPVEVAPLAVLRDAEFLADWADDDERVVELYAIARKGDEKAQLYLVVEGFEPELRRRIMAAPMVPAFFMEARPTIEVDKTDAISVEFDAGEEVAKIMFATRTAIDESEDEKEGPIDIATPDGEVRIRVESVD